MAGDADRDLRMVVPFDEVKIGALILSPVGDEGADDAAGRADRVGIAPPPMTVLATREPFGRAPGA